MIDDEHFYVETTHRLSEFIKINYQSKVDLLRDLSVILSDIPGLSFNLINEASERRPNGPLIKKIKNNHDIKSALLKMPSSHEVIFIYMPHFTLSENMSHRLLYISWVKRIAQNTTNPKIKIFYKNTPFNDVDIFLKKSLPSEIYRNIKHYSISKNKNYFEIIHNDIKVRPHLSFYFETVETIKDSPLKIVGKLSPSLGIHCNPSQPINSEMDATFVGYEGRVTKNCHFLPTLIDTQPNYYRQTRNDTNIITSAFTCKRISKHLIKNKKLCEELYLFITNHDVEWHFICDDCRDDFVGIPQSLMELIGVKIKIIPLQKDLSINFSKSDIFSILPGMMGGDATAYLALLCNLPIMAMRTKQGYIKYATEELVADNMESYFKTLSKLTTAQHFYSEYLSHQKNSLSKFTERNQEKKFNAIIKTVLNGECE